MILENLIREECCQKVPNWQQVGLGLLEFSRAGPSDRKSQFLFLIEPPLRLPILANSEVEKRRSETTTTRKFRTFGVLGDSKLP